MAKTNISSNSLLNKFFHYQYLSLDILYTYAVYDAIMSITFYFHLQYHVKSVVLEHLRNKLSNLNFKIPMFTFLYYGIYYSNSLITQLQYDIIRFSFFASPHSSQIKTPTCYVNRPAYATRVLMTLYV